VGDRDGVKPILKGTRTSEFYASRLLGAIASAIDPQDFDAAALAALVDIADALDEEGAR
jgi:hypothetical protein